MGNFALNLLPESIDLDASGTFVPPIPDASSNRYIFILYRFHGCLSPIPLRKLVQIQGNLNHSLVSKSISFSKNNRIHF